MMQAIRYVHNVITAVLNVIQAQQKINALVVQIQLHRIDLIILMEPVVTNVHANLEHWT
jgi:hypothetical protein